MLILIAILREIINIIIYLVVVVNRLFEMGGKFLLKERKNRRGDKQTPTWARVSRGGREGG